VGPIPVGNSWTNTHCFHRDYNYNLEWVLRVKTILFVTYLKKILNSYIHIYYSRFIPEGVAEHLRYSSETPTFNHNDLAMRNNTDVSGGKPIAVRWQSVSGVSTVIPLVAFYDIHVRKKERRKEVFYFVPDTIRDNEIINER
jgi:hypothetical protein